MAKNAYVKLNIRPNGTFLTLYPPVEGGRGLIIDEVEAYLDKIFRTDKGFAVGWSEWSLRNIEIAL